MAGATQRLTRRIKQAVRVAAGLAAAAFPVVAATQALVASGACRDGIPNGMYELRTPDGKLRVAGAFAMERRTGTFLFWTSAGARIAVIPYDDDARSGTVAAWYVRDRAATESSHRLEAPFVAGERHGTSRSWYDNGKPRGEYVYEHGRLVDARGWTEVGTPLSASVARAQAERDEHRDDRFIGSLERLVAGHKPHCT
jgi:hypothetical protein